MEARSAQRLDANARTLLVSVSPQAGARSSEGRASELVSALESAGYRVQKSTDLDEVADLAAKWHAAGELRCVLACGGDGTAAVVRNRTPLDVPILLVPMGTENLLGRYVSQSASPAAVCQTVDRGVAISLDLGRLRADGAADRYFLTMISAGFDAEVVRRLHERRRGNIRRISYVQPTLEAIRSYEYPELRLYCDRAEGEHAEPARCRWVFGFNLPLYACGWKLAPDADGTDELLDICTFHNGSLRHVAWYLWHVMRQSHMQLADAQLTRSRSLRIEAANSAAVPYQVDGDFGGMLPVDVDVLPGQLRMLVMPDVARKHGFHVE